jgi:hypothetical protein
MVKIRGYPTIFFVAINDELSWDLVARKVALFGFIQLIFLFEQLRQINSGP